MARMIRYALAVYVGMLIAGTVAPPAETTSHADVPPVMKTDAPPQPPAFQP